MKGPQFINFFYNNAKIKNNFSTNLYRSLFNTFYF